MRFGLVFAGARVCVCVSLLDSSFSCCLFIVTTWPCRVRVGFGLVCVRACGRVCACVFGCFSRAPSFLLLLIHCHHLANAGW